MARGGLGAGIGIGIGIGIGYSMDPQITEAEINDIIAIIQAQEGQIAALQSILNTEGHDAESTLLEMATENLQPAKDNLNQSTVDGAPEDREGYLLRAYDHFKVALYLLAKTNEILSEKGDSRAENVRNIIENLWEAWELISKENGEEEDS